MAPKTRETSCLALVLSLYGLVPQCHVWGADVLFLLLNLMENVGSLVPCLLRILHVPVCSQAY